MKNLFKQLRALVLLVLGASLSPFIGSAATSVRSSSSSSSPTGSAISVPAPQGTAAGDVVIVVVHGNGQTTIADNNGSTPFAKDLNDYQPNASSGMTVSIFSRRIQSGDPSSYNFTLGTGDRWSAVAITFQNPDSSAIYDIAPSVSYASYTDCQPCASTVTIPCITTITDGAIHVAVGLVDGSSSSVASGPAGYTLQQATTPQAIGLYTKNISPAGATGIGTFTFNHPDGVIGLSFAVKNGGAVITDTQPPSVPTNLTATAVSSSQINLSWTASTDNVGVTGYNIHRGGVKIGTAVTTSYSDSGLLPSTAYAYAVSAFDGAGNTSAQSASVSATTFPASTDTQPPSVPTNLTATAVSSSQINLSWTASTDNVGVTGYNIYRGGVKIGTAATTSYSDSGLLPSTAYAYVVSAFDGAGNTSAQSSSASATTFSASTANGISSPLRPNPANPHYFTDATGKAILLTGSQTWNSFQDTDQSSNPAPIDFTAYVNFLKAHNHNCTILWKKDLPTYCNWGAGGTWQMTPHPWLRTGGAGGTQRASDGKPAFDFNQFNQAYFDRLRARTIQLQTNGIYAIVQLFDGLGLSSFSCSNDGYPFNSGNNINGINGGGTATMTMSATNAVTAIQDDYVRKVIDTVNDLPNVLYEISEEAPNNTTWWQGHMIALIHSYEARKPLQHPVGYPTLNVGSPNDQSLYDSDAEWVAPAAKISPTSSCGSGTPTCKVNINDSDHSYLSMWNDSAQANRSYIWENFARGNQVVFMDPYLINWPSDNRNLPANPVNGVGSAPDTRWDNFRDNMGYTLTYARKMNLVNMTPQGNLSSTGYVLANTSPTASEFLVFTPNGGSFTVNLSSSVNRTLNVEWLNPGTGATTSGAAIAGGSASQSFTAPFNGDAVLYLVDKGDTQAPTAPTNLKATAVSSSQINLTWTASTDNVGVTGYKIFRGGIQTGTSTANSYTDTGLSASTTYTYTVSAFDAAGNSSAQSAPASATTQTPPRGTLTLLSFSGGAPTLSINGAAGLKYALEATTNFVNWTSLVITTAPSIFVVSNATGLNAEFFRTRFVP